MRYGAWLIGFAILVTATGCSNARLLESTNNGGCVAIPNNSDTWPSYNMSKARDLMSKECPAGYKIVAQKEVVTGQTTVNNTQRDTKETPIIKGLTGVQETTRNTSEVQDRTEWRIWYEKLR